MTFDYGMKDKNPIDEMRFYSKQNPNNAYRVRRDQVSKMLPHTFIEKTVSVYCKKHNIASLRMAKKYVHLRVCGQELYHNDLCEIVHGHWPNHMFYHDIDLFI